MELDDIHLRMIDVLRRDGRISIAALAQEVGISRANAYTRFEALTSSGIVQGFRAEVEPQAVGMKIAALVFVTLEQSLWTDFRSRLGTLPELEYFAVTTGEHDAMLLVRARDVAEVHGLVAARMSQWPSVKATETVFLMDELHFTPTLTDADDEDPDGDRHGMTRFVRTDRRAGSR